MLAQLQLHQVPGEKLQGRNDCCLSIFTVDVSRETVAGPFEHEQRGVAAFRITPVQIENHVTIL
jgi:hypothetical protein